MARTIEQIRTEMAERALERIDNLSTSKTAEWRLWTYIYAAAIHAFEVIMDIFRAEIKDLTTKNTPGTLYWYAEMCYRFQDKDELKYDEKTATLYYPVEDESKRIVKIVAITEGPGRLSFKVAKEEGGKIVALTKDEKYNFEDYIDTIKFAGTQTTVLSNNADKLSFQMNVYYDPVIPKTNCEENIMASLSEFKSALSFNAMFYKQRLIEAVMAVEGVVTVDLSSIEIASEETDWKFIPVDVMHELESGYFEYADDVQIKMISIKKMNEEND